jgi:UDP-N-acetylmuramate dehydrogenase
VSSNPQSFPITLRGELETQVSLARLCSWRVGGKAARLYKPADLTDVVEFVRSLDLNEPLTWLGLGSNVLIRDNGIPGTVIITQNRLNGMSKLTDVELRIEAGVPCAKIAKFAIKHGLSGAEFFAGIPGTMGGALAMNAGAFGGETWEHVIEVEVLTRDGRVLTRSPNEYQIGYRTAISPAADEAFLAARLRLTKGDGAQAAENVKALLQKRSETQPIGLPSGGSVFRNPPGDHAGRLIESAGLKGFSLGGAQVSEKHANFIVQHGKATAADIENLIKQVAEAVKAKHNIQLETEVRILGVL